MIEKQEEYIPADQAIALLGVKPAKFYYHADRGEIHTETQAKPGKGKKNNRYLVSDILAVKQKLQEKRRRPAPVLIDWLLSEDVPAGLRLDQQVYGEEIDLAEAAIYQGWRKHNRQITLAAFSLDRKECYASLQVIPVNEPIILEILSGRRTESSISPDEIRAYDAPGAYTLLVTSAVCLKDRPILLFELLSRYMQFWIDMYPEKYIHKVYGQAMSPRGEMLVQHLFMTPRYDLAYNAYELDLARPSASKIIRNFKAALQEKAPLPDELQWPPITQETPVAPSAVIHPPTTPARTREARSSVTQPIGTITIIEMARLLGIDKSTLHEQLIKHKLPHEALENPARPGEKKRFFDAEQQAYIIQWHNEHKRNKS
jgi:hypothetical protein